MSQPAMCVGVLTYNRGERVVETLRAVAGMDRAGGRLARVVVIDNNSTDGTGAIVDGFAREHPAWNIARVVERVQGIGPARARLVREATEPYLAMLDDDVLPDTGWAAEMIRMLDAHPRAGWVGGRVDLLWESGPTGLARRCATMLAAQDRGAGEVLLAGKDEGMASAAFAARREAIEETGWTRERMLGGRTGGALESGEDYELCIRLRQRGWEVWYTGAARARHQIPARRQTVEYLAKLARGVSLSKAQLKWLAEGKPAGTGAIAWAQKRLAQARGRKMRSALLEWRPGVRAIKRAEHEGRVESWERLVAVLSAECGARSGNQNSAL